MSLNLEKQLVFVSAAVTVTSLLSTDSIIVRLVPSCSRKLTYVHIIEVPRAPKTFIANILRSKLNKAIHIICVPTILMTSFLLVSAVGITISRSFTADTGHNRVQTHPHLFQCQVGSSSQLSRQLWEPSRRCCMQLFTC